MEINSWGRAGEGKFGWDPSLPRVMVEMVVKLLRPLSANLIG